MEQLQVIILSENESGKLHQHRELTETMVNASRMLLTYKPKKGYKIVSYHIMVIETLV